MTSITIRNIPDDLLNKIRARAKEEQRSVNSEIIRILEQAQRDHVSNSIFDFMDEVNVDADFLENVKEAYSSRNEGREFIF